jgi:hypothetical protein
LENQLVPRTQQHGALELIIIAARTITTSPLFLTRAGRRPQSHVLREEIALPRNPVP